jgi:hypothetical protein
MKMKKIFVIVLLTVCCQSLTAQNVGIGTTTPNTSAQLDVTSINKGILIPRLTFVQRNAIPTPATGLLIYQTDFVNGFYFYNGSVWTQLSTGSATNYFTASGSNIYNNNTGNVGIGLTSPAEKFHLKGAGRIDAAGSFGGAALNLYAATTNDGSYISFFNEFGATNSSAEIGYSGSNDYLLLSRGTNMFLKTAGLGISVAEPLTKLHIAGGQDAGFGATSNGYIMNGAVTGANLVIDNNEILARNNDRKADLFLQHDSGNVVLCGLEQGAVGIGVTSGSSIPAGFLLAVDGKIISEEVKVQLSGNWPDYVFDEKYALLSLAGLKKYIAVNKHLPNIPSAAEVKKNGIEIGDMQKKLTQTVEELTLYILELKKEIDLLKKHVYSNN